MYEAVDSFLEMNNDIYAGTEEFVIHRNSFRHKLDEIGLKEDERNKATTGKTREKRVTKNSVVTQALAVAGAIRAFAKKAGNITLEETTRFSQTKFNKLRDQELIIELNSINEKAVTYRDSISKYGIPAEDLDNFRESILIYSEAVGAKDTGGATKKGAFKSLKDLFSETDSLLESLDLLMEHYIKSDAEFYAGYKAARVIRNLGIRHEQHPESAAGVVSEKTVVVAGSNGSAAKEVTS